MSICCLQPADPFQVALQDYYGNQGLAENAGTCEIIYNGTDITVPELGRVVDISNGTGLFQQVKVQGNKPLTPLSQDNPTFCDFVMLFLTSGAKAQDSCYHR